MEFRDLLARRRMHRAYLPEAVPRETVERIVRTIRRAPSGGFSQGASVVVVTDPARRAAIVKARRADLPPDYQGGRDWMADAPVFLVVCTNEEHYHRRYREADKLAVTGGRETEWPVPYWYVDAGAYLMLVLLAAIDEGLGAAFWGFPSQRRTLRELLALPDEVVPIGVVSLGRPAPDPGQERAAARFRERRRPDDDVIHWERWGAD
jgi:nitroreductase